MLDGIGVGTKTPSASGGCRESSPFRRKLTGWIA